MTLSCLNKTLIESLLIFPNNSSSLDKCVLKYEFILL